MCLFDEEILCWSKLLQPINYRFCGRKPIRTSRLMAGTLLALLLAWLKATLLWSFWFWASFSQFVYAFCISPVLSAWQLFFIIFHPQNGRSIHCFAGEGRRWKRASSRGIGSARQRAETHPRQTGSKIESSANSRQERTSGKRKRKIPVPQQCRVSIFLSWFPVNHYRLVCCYHLCVGTQNKNYFFYGDLATRNWSWFLCVYRFGYI